MEEAWVEKYSEQHKRKYWANKVTGKTTWTNPHEGTGTSAPSTNGNQEGQKQDNESNEWVEKYSEQHKRKYWANKATGKTSWTNPHQGSGTSAPSTSRNEQKQDNESNDWVEKYSEQHKRKYWANKVTGKTTWTNPKSEVPTSDTKTDEWVEKYSEQHKRKYWANKATGKTSWTNPNSAVSSTSTSSESEWVEKYSEQHKRKYWANKSTGKTTWTNPIPSSNTSSSSTATTNATSASSDEWTEKFSAKHNRKYWVNKEGKTSWHDPKKSSSNSSTTTATESTSASASLPASSSSVTSTTTSSSAEVDSSVQLKFQQLENELDEFHQKHTDLQQKFSQVTQERDQLIQKVETLTQEHENLIEKWNQEKEELNKNYHNTQLQFKEMQAECVRLTTERDIYQQLHQEDEKRRDKSEEEKMKLLTQQLMIKQQQYQQESAASSDSSPSVPLPSPSPQLPGPMPSLHDIISLQSSHEHYIRKLHAEHEIKILEERAKHVKELNILQQGLAHEQEKYQLLQQSKERLEKALMDMKEKYSELEIKFCQKCDEIDAKKEENYQIIRERNELQQLIEVKSQELVKYLQQQQQQQQQSETVTTSTTAAGRPNPSVHDENIRMMSLLTNNLLKEVHHLLSSSSASSSSGNQKDGERRRRGDSSSSTYYRGHGKRLSQIIPNEAPPIERYLDVVYDDLEPPPPEDVEEDDLPSDDPEDYSSLLDPDLPDSPPPMDL